MNKNTLIAIIVIIVLALGGYWLWMQEQETVVETVPNEEKGINVGVEGEVQGATDKDSAPEMPY